METNARHAAQRSRDDERRRTFTARHGATGGTMTSRAQHTPGPWTVRKGRTTHWVETPRSFQIAEVYEGEANARLIAAAPALLEALRECADMLDKYAQGHWSQDYFNVKARARAILREIEGAPAPDAQGGDNV